MNRAIKIRLAALGLGIGLMGAMIVGVTLILQSLANVSKAKLNQMDLESFHIADHFRDKLRFANDKMRAFATTEEPAAWDEFLSASHELKTWLDEQKLRLSNDREQRLLKEMDAAHAVYLQKAADLRNLIMTDSTKGASLAQYNTFLEYSRHFLDLGQELGRIHFESRNEVVAHASRTLTDLRLLVLVLVGLLFLFGVALARGVYRDLIAPLQVRLVETEALVERNEKLAALGLLAAGVAHELRTPLTAIKTALFIQQKKIEPGSATHQDHQLIEREIVRLERIVSQFLQFARPARPELGVISADQPLREVEALMAPVLARAEIQLTREESKPMKVQADSSQIKQVLINLVQNAADSIGRSGTISLRARPGHQRLTNGETDVVVLEVADTGKGISPEVEKRLFDPFFTTKPAGMGLGLSIAARIVEMNGGALQYQTQINRGSTFGVVLPRLP